MTADDRPKEYLCAELLKQDRTNHGNPLKRLGIRNLFPGVFYMCEGEELWACFSEQ